MPNTKIEQTLQQGLAHHNAGRLQQAETIYRQILATYPNHPDALHLLGVLAGQAGRHDLATDFFLKAVAISPRNADYQRNLGLSLQNQGQFVQAAAALRRATVLAPHHADAHLHLGNALWNAGDFQGALASYQRVVAIDAGHVDAHSNIGTTLLKLGQPQAAVVHYQRAVALQPLFLQAHHNLVSTLVELGRFEEAIASGRRALVSHSNNAELHNLLGNALKGHAQGDQAIASYRRALELMPDYAEVYNNLGNVLREQGELSQAIESHRRAVQLAPTNGEFHFSLGAALQTDEQSKEAIQSYQRALEFQPDDPKIHHNLGKTWSEEKDLANAILAMEKAIELKPDYAEAMLNLGIYLWKSGLNAKAQEIFERAIRTKPNYAEAYNNLGVLLSQVGKLDQAVACHEKAIELKPNYLEAHQNLGNDWKEKGLLDRAIVSYERALALDSKNFQVLCSLGAAWKEAGYSDRAMGYYEKAMAEKPDETDLLAGIGGVYLLNGQLDQALSCYRKAISIDPKLGYIHDALLLVSLYSPNTTAQLHFAESQQWDLQHAQPQAHLIGPHKNDCSGDRKLRVGYVSADLREHVVARFLLPLLQGHDRELVDYFGYADVKRPDAITARMQSYAAGWRDISGMGDDKIAEQIREDKIDILVDLSGHTGGNRLTLFALKPAPVQVTYLGYPASTGMTTMDYRLTDALADPPGLTENFHTETLVRLDPTAWCFEPSPDFPAVYPSPAKQNKYVTFGSFNNFAKVNSELIGWWMQILQLVPDSRLLIKSKGIKASVPQQNIRKIIAEHGIAQDRVELIDWVNSGDHWSQFSRVDIALDSYPYHGTTTTFESLWMGVPVITLAGASHVSRVGVSLLTNVGLPELIATTPQQYMQIAADLARDLPRLFDLRSTLRQRLQNSPLMDGPRFARSVEDAYRTMWMKWCSTHV